MTGLSPADLAGAKVLILGVGLLGGGVGMAKFCADHGAELLITDLRSPDLLAPTVAALEGTGARLVLGEHRREDVDWADIVIRNPGVRPDNEFLRYAIQQGKTVDMELAFFVRNTTARAYGVTGTKGKTTVTSMLSTFLGPGVPMAGNMGESAIGLLDAPAAEVLLELSSYQLEGFETDAGRFRVAVVTNIDDDHLDRYVTVEAYAKAKGLIASGQTADDWLVLPAADKVAQDAVAGSPAQRALVHREGADLTPGSGDLHVGIVGDAVVIRRHDGDETILDLRGLPLRGAHNRLNAAFAATAAHLAGRSRGSLDAVVASIEPVPHRFELVRELDGIEFINDTAATAPVAVVAALDSLHGHGVSIICGGHDKAADFAPMVRALASSGASVTLLPGSATDRILVAIEHLGAGIQYRTADSMHAAVATAYATARDEGLDTVLLSPGCASFGLFVNEFDRGEKFRAEVLRL